MAEAVGRPSDLPRRGGREEEEILRAEYVPLPQRRRPPRGPPPGLHRQRHLRPLQAALRLQRAQPHGLRRLRPARRAVCHTDGPAPCHNHRAEHQPLPRAARQDRLLLRLEPRGEDLRPGVLQVDAVGLPADVQELLQRQLEQGAADHQAHRALRAHGH